jgi:hypothetical protein
MATTYYVSNSGNDANTGLTTSLAWKSISKVNSTTFKAGDQILFQKGGTFYGGITVNNSGIKGNPITYGAYGTGANPIITGLTTVTAWTNLGNNIWESTSAVSTLPTCNVVVINGSLTPMGRYPNLGSIPAYGDYLRITSKTTTSITNSALTGTPNWTGATAVVRLHRTSLARIPIISQSGSTINFGKSSQFATNYGFFIQNSSLTLDAQNEWYYNPITKKIQVYSVVQPTDVKVASVEKVITIDREDYITIENLSIIGSNGYGIYKYNGGDSQRVKYNIRNCSINFTGLYGIYLNSIDNVLIENNSFYYSNGMAMYLSGNDHLTIRNNDIRHSGKIKGADIDASTYSAIGFSNGCLKVTVENNQIIDTGNNGITFDGDSVMIRNNFIDTFNQIIDDGAGITGGNRTTDETIDTGNTITGNIVINGIGADVGATVSGNANGGFSSGIYTADQITYLTISNNHISNCAFKGLFIKWSDYVNAIGNTVYDCYSIIQIEDWVSGVHHTVTGNIFVGTNRSVDVAKYMSHVDANFNTIQVADNNYYARPINNTNTISFAKTPNTGNTTLASWQAYSKLDLNSKTSPVSITSENDLQFEYNASKTVKTVSLSRPMIDVKGTKYASSVTLQPYSSVVLIKDPKPAQPEATSPVLTYTIPGIVQAEDYAAYNNVQYTQMRVATTDGGTKMGYNDAGDWYDYSVNVATAGTYTVTFRVANVATTVGQVQLLKGTAVLTTVDVAPTGGLENFVTLTKTVTLAAGTQTLRINAITAGVDYNWFEFKHANTCTATALTAFAQINGGLWQQTAASTINAGGSIVLGPQPTSGGTWSWTGPNGFTADTREIRINNIQATQVGNYVSSFTNSCGTKSSITNTITLNNVVSSKAIPGIVQAEDYAAHNNTEPAQMRIVTTDGGIKMGWNNVGDWYDYSVNVATAGAYMVTFRVANGTNSVSQFQLLKGTAVLTTVDISPTGGWDNFVTLTKNVTLTAGTQTLRINTVTAGVDYNWFEFKQANGCVATSLTPFAQLNSGMWQQTTVSTINPGGSIVLGPQPTSGGTWSWTGPNGFTANTREIRISNIQATQAGSYVSSFTNSCGIKSSISNTIEVVSFKSATVGINDRSIENEILIYPVPMTSMLNLKGVENVQKISVYNSVGQLLKQYQKGNETLFNIDVNELKSGIYFVELSNASEKITKKVIKK